MKSQKTLSIDDEIIKRIKKDAEKQIRSESFIVNEILKKHYLKGGGKHDK